MARLQIRLLGPLEVTLDGQPVSGFESDKVRALLAFLAVESDRPHRREKLAGLLWPDSTEESARTNLRRALSNLRSVIRDQGAARPLLDASAQTVQLDRAGGVWVDAVALEQHVTASRCLDAGGRHPADTASRLQSAVELYRGPFLEGFSVDDGAAFEEWALLEQERLHRLVLEALHCLAEQLEAQGEVERALGYAWRQVELEPWRESGHQQVMRLLARTGQRSAALAQYEACRRSLARDLGAEPSAETTDLYRRIRDQVDGAGGAAPPRRAAPPPAAEAELTAPPSLAGTLRAAAQPQPQGAAARRWSRGVRLAAGAVALLAVLAVAAVLATQPWRSEPGAAADRTTSQAGSTGLERGSTVTAAVPAPQPTLSVTPTVTFPCRIVFASAEVSGTQTLAHIYVMDRDGRQRTLLPGHDDAVEESRPVWLPGRRGIVYERIERTENAKRFSLWRMNADGSGRQPLFGGADARSAALSPDGTRIAFNSKRDGIYQVFVADLDGGGMVQLTQAGWDSRRPTWSPDGQRLAFDAGDKGVSSIYVVGSDGSSLEQLTEATQDIDPSWSTDGRSIAFESQRDGNLEIYVMNADGSAQVNVSNTPQADDRDVSWTPDQHLVFASNRDGDWEIYVMNRNGSHVVKLTDNTVDDHWPNWK